MMMRLVPCQRYSRIISARLVQKQNRGTGGRVQEAVKCRQAWLLVASRRAGRGETRAMETTIWELTGGKKRTESAQKEKGNCAPTPSLRSLRRDLLNGAQKTRGGQEDDLGGQSGP